MNLSILPETFALCRLSPDQDVPAWALQHRAFLSITLTTDELSIVCEQSLIPQEVQCERDWAAIKVQGPLDFALTGILSVLASPLAEHGIAIFAISTFDTDYLLVKRHALPQTIAVLEQQGHTFF
jgi:hypothetical protein